MDLQLAGKVAIVTGASRGIGRAIAQTLATEAMRVVLVAHSRERLDQVAASCGTESLVQEVDLRDPGAPAAVAAATVERFGRIDVLVNNAGATLRRGLPRLARRGLGRRLRPQVLRCHALLPGRLAATQGEQGCRRQRRRDRRQDGGGCTGGRISGIAAGGLLSGHDR